MGINYGIAAVYNPISIKLFEKFQSTVVFEGVSPYSKMLTYKIYQINFPRITNLNLKPKL